ncbi:hypothetical protein [Thermoleptolyngbya sp. C42_A2020_037]|uniref:hypothetical protein n=1 Tax=Thermoleptolyngbya sp. C42_A2020_037 TaxID=2747799 RepID=UPI0019E40C32|nr:hypothetical protein [Thermoleptolyngbya sp. C42_A2020_037]MBF2084509.1 hypothetical protein [Thermoleptolyngbya sp. C42_A2020_037]
MTYQDQLSPWVVYKLLPTMQNVPVARFRYRNDAESYLKLVSRVLPQTSFLISFDGPIRPAAEQPTKATPATATKTAKKARTTRRKASLA